MVSLEQSTGSGQESDARQGGKSLMPDRGVRACPAPGLVSELAPHQPPRGDSLPTSSFLSCASGAITSACRDSSDARSRKGQCRP